MKNWNTCLENAGKASRLSAAVPSTRLCMVLGVGLLQAFFLQPSLSYAQDIDAQDIPPIENAAPQGIAELATPTQEDLAAFDALEAELEALQAETDSSETLETTLTPSGSAPEAEILAEIPPIEANIQTDQGIALETEDDSTQAPSIPPSTTDAAEVAEEMATLDALIEDAFLDTPDDIRSLDTSALTEETDEAPLTHPSSEVSAAQVAELTSPELAPAEVTSASASVTPSVVAEADIPVEHLLPAEEPLENDEIGIQTLPILRAIAKAVDYSREVAISSEKVRQAAFDIDKSKSAYFPKLDFNFAAGREYKSPGTGRTKYDPIGQAMYMNSSDINLSFNQMLFDGFSTKADVNEKQLLLLAAYHGANVIRHKTAKNVIDTLVDIRSQLNKINTVRAYVTELTKFSAKMDAAAEEGGVSDTLKKYVDSRVAFAGQTKIQAETALQDALENYAFLTGEDNMTVDKLTSITLPDLPQTRSFSLYKETLLKFNPELLQKRADWVASKHTVQKLKGDLYPSLHLKGAWGETNDAGGYIGRVTTGSVMMELSYNIFDGGKAKAKRDSAKSQEMEGKLQIVRTARDLSRKLKSAWQELKAKQAEYDLVKKELESSQKVKELRTQEFKEGAGELLSVVEAVEDLQAATIRKLGIEEELTRQRYTLEFLTGRPALIDMPNITPNSPNDPAYEPLTPSVQGQRLAQAAEQQSGVDATPLEYNAREKQVAKGDIQPYREPTFQTEAEIAAEEKMFAEANMDDGLNMLTGFPQNEEPSIGDGMASIPTETFVTAFGERIRQRKTAETLASIPDPLAETASLHSLILPDLAVANVNPIQQVTPLKQKSYEDPTQYSLAVLGTADTPHLAYVPPKDLVPHTLKKGVTPPQSFSSVFNQHPELYEAEQGLLAQTQIPKPLQQQAPSQAPASLAEVPNPQARQATLDGVDDTGLHMQANWDMPQVPLPQATPYAQNAKPHQHKAVFADMPTRPERLKQEPLTIQFDGPEKTRKFLVPLQQRQRVLPAVQQPTPVKQNAIQPLVQKAPQKMLTQDDFPSPAAGPAQVQQVSTAPALPAVRPSVFSVPLSEPLQKNNRMVMPLH